MMQNLVDNALGVAKESIRTFCQESFNSFVKILNGLSALVLAVLPGKTNALEAVTGWEQYPQFRAPHVPKWMEEGVSSFNHFFDLDGSDTEGETTDSAASDTDEDDGSSSSVPSSPYAHAASINYMSSSRPGSFSRFPGDPSNNNSSGNGYISSSSSSSFSRSGSARRTSFLKRMFRKLTWPIRFILRVLRITKGRPPDGNSTPKGPGTGSPGGFGAVRNRENARNLRRSAGSTGSLKTMLHAASKHFTDMRDMAVNHRTTDSRRRGVIEDLQLGVELAIEKVFDVVRRWIHYFLSPFQTFKAILRQIFFPEESTEEEDANGLMNQTATLGESDASATLNNDRRYAQQPLNTDARTCGDFITAMGYPYESLKVTTTDGYILSLERIPRPESKKVLYLQHGILDSSLGWVSSGVVGSQAFAAFDQGFDVFLGNFRGLASREHVNKKISSRRYWRYSVNEHGKQDIPAMLNKVHELKMSELKSSDSISQEALEAASDARSTDNLPYSLCGVSHSLGGAAMLIYIVTRRLEGKHHYLKRLILLSPSGFHQDAPPACHIAQYAVPLIAPFVRPVLPGLYIPTKFFRMVFNKLSRDFQNYPALGGLVQTLMSYVVGGDSSNWIGAFGMTHYNMNDMPGIAFNVGLHLTQMMRRKRFIMFDYGSAAENRKVYGTPEPLDVGANYAVIDIPVDVVAGKKDKLIPKSMVAKHYKVLMEAGVKASYSEFEYAHLDFTFSNKDEVLEYVMSRLLLIEPTSTAGHGKLRRNAKSLKGNDWKDWKGWNEGFERDKRFYIDSKLGRSKIKRQESAKQMSKEGADPSAIERSGSNGEGMEEHQATPSAAGSGGEQGSEERSASFDGEQQQQQSRKQKVRSKRFMSYRDCHAAASKFVNEMSRSFSSAADPRSSKAADEDPEEEQQRSKSAITATAAAAAFADDESEQSALGSSSARMAGDKDSNASEVANSSSTSRVPSGLARLWLPESNFRSSSTNGRRGLSNRRGTGAANKKEL